METNRNDQQLEKEQLSAEAEQKETAHLLIVSWISWMF